MGTTESKTEVIAARQLGAVSTQQLMFIHGILNGKTQKQAYRHAYLNDRSNDKNICVTANRLLHSPKIQVLIQSINSNARELLADDRKATRVYVFRELFALSKQAKQERHKIKALELLGKSCGLFKHVDMGVVKAPNEQALTEVLHDRLRTVEEMR